MTVDVYTKPACGACVATKKHLDKRGIEYTERPISYNAVSMARAADIAAAPIIAVDGVPAWGGYRPDRIDALVP